MELELSIGLDAVGLTLALRFRLSLDDRLDSVRHAARSL